jgi:hypothetical protein
MNPYYVWSRFIMGRAFLIAKRLEKELNAKRGEANPLIIGRRVQFYRDDPVNVLSFFDNNQAILVSSTLRKAGIPEKLKAYNTTIPLTDPDKFMRDPLLRAIGYLDGKVNISVSDALFNVYNQNEIIGFDKVTLDLDISNECISIDQAREWGNKVVNALKSLTGVEPIIAYSGCKGIHAVYFLNNIVEIEYLAPLRQALVKYSGLARMDLKLDPQTQEPKHVFRLPLTTNLKTGNKAELIHFTSFSNHVLNAELAKSLATLLDRLLGREIVVTLPQAQVSVSKPLTDKASQWSAFIKWLRDNNIKLRDCRKRFAYLLGMYCKQVGIGEGDCEGLLNELVSEVRSEHTRLLHYGYSKPEYLPSVYAFVRGSEWYSCNEVEELRDFRIPRVTQPEPTVPQPTTTTPEPKPEIPPTPATETRPEVKPTEPKPKEPIPEVPKPETSKTKPGKPSTTNTSNRKVIKGSEIKTGKQARLTGFIGKPTKPSTQTTIEEDWSKILRPEKKKVIPCSELGDECRFFHNCLELFEWRSWSGEPVFQRPKGYFEIEGLFTSEEHERLHKKLYELVINGKLQEALKLWDEVAEKELPVRMEKARRRNREILMEWVRKNCSDSAVVNPLSKDTGAK